MFLCRHKYYKAIIYYFKRIQGHLSQKHHHVDLSLLMARFFFFSPTSHFCSKVHLAILLLRLAPAKLCSRFPHQRLCTLSRKALNKSHCQAFP